MFLYIGAYYSYIGYHDTLDSSLSQRVLKQRNSSGDQSRLLVRLEDSPICVRPYARVLVPPNMYVHRCILLLYFGYHDTLVSSRSQRVLGQRDRGSNSSKLLALLEYSSNSARTLFPIL